MSDDLNVRATDEAPDTELGQLADAMLKLTEAHDDVKAIVMLVKDDEGMTAHRGYDDDDEAGPTVDLFVYLRVLLEANGKELVLLDAT